MRRPDFIARQAGSPSGLIGRLLAGVMFFETAKANETTLRILELRPEDHVLEIGFGHGRTLAKAAAMVQIGFAAGVEVSPLMMKIAEERSRRLLQQGRVQLKLGNGSAIPYPDSSFDKCYSVHSIYFWPKPLDLLKEIRRVLRPKCRLVLCFRYDQEALRSFPENIYRLYTPQQVVAMLEECGFRDIRVEGHAQSSHSLFWAIGD